MMAARRGLGGSPSLGAGFKTLAVSKARGVSLIELNRPRKKNAFDVDMYHELQTALRDASEDPSVRVALLTGRGDYYSSGNDLSNFSQLMHPLTTARRSKEILLNFVDAFIEMKKPLVCAVNGPAIGIAVTTLGLCDVVLASSTATFRTPFAELHQSPEGRTQCSIPAVYFTYLGCSSFTFPRIMGPEMAEKVLWKGVKLSAEEALQYRLVHEVCSPDNLLASAMLRCEQLAAMPPCSPELQRKIVTEGLVDKLKKVNVEECEILEKKWVSKECFAALAAYLSSRNLHVAAFVLR